MRFVHKWICHYVLEASCHLSLSAMVGSSISWRHSSHEALHSQHVGVQRNAYTLFFYAIGLTSKYQLSGVGSAGTDTWTELGRVLCLHLNSHIGWTFKKTCACTPAFVSTADVCEIECKVTFLQSLSFSDRNTMLSMQSTAPLRHASARSFPSVEISQCAASEHWHHVLWAAVRTQCISAKK